MWKWLVITPLLLAAPIAAIAIAGAFLPREHTATVRIEVSAAPDAVWPLVEKIEAWPEWNPAIGIERLPDSAEGRAVYAWTANGDRIPTEVVVSTNGRLVTRILDDGLPFGGTWTWEVAPSAKGSTVTITEDGFIKNTVFRFLAHYVFGYTSSMEQMLAALSKKVDGK